MGSLIYDMICIRPDLAYAVSTVSRFMSNPGKQHWETVKWVYPRGTVRLGLIFQRLKMGKPRLLQDMLMQIMWEILISEDLRRAMHSR